MKYTKEFIENPFKVKEGEPDYYYTIKKDGEVVLKMATTDLPKSLEREYLSDDQIDNLLEGFNFDGK